MRTLATLALLALLPGCLASSASRTTYSGETVCSDAAEQLTPGCSPEFVTGLLGSPSTRTELPGGGSLWKWSSCRTEASGGRVFLLFNTQNEVESETHFFVEFDEAGATRWWRQGA